MGNFEKSIRPVPVAEGEEGTPWRCVESTRQIEPLPDDCPHAPTPIEAMLKESDRALLLVVEAAPIALVVVDENGLIGLINRMAARLFDYAPAELVGQPLTRLIPEMHRERHLAQCANYFAAPYVRPMGAGLDLWAQRKDGTTFSVEVSLGTVETRLGRLAMAFVVDITRRHEVEQLREAMVHTMVHDLRSPLGSIITALKIITMDRTAQWDAEQQQLLQIAQNGADKLLSLVNAILDVSRLESGQMPLARARILLSSLLADVLETLKPLALDKQIALNLAIPPTLPPVWVDAHLIGRVFQNLVGNALKFTPEGGAITIAARQEGNKILATVSDTGPGISPELRGRLFQKFVTGKIAGRGSGLGLAFCKLVLEAHGGRITVASEVGRGTTFTFSLPVSEGPA